MNQERTIHAAEALAAGLLGEEREARERGRTPNEWQRWAVVFASPEAIASYLPANYEVVGHIVEGFKHPRRYATVIAGHDHAGWTLEDYVIPRLGSGLYSAVEILQGLEDRVDAIVDLLGGEEES